MPATTGKFPYPFWIIISCCALMTSGISIPLSCAGLFYTSVCQELGVGVGPLSFYMTLQCVASALALPMASRLLSTRDARAVLSGAVLLCALSFGVMGLYRSLAWFYVSGVLLGVSGSFLVYLCVPILVNNWFRQRVGTAMGVAYAFIGVGAAIFSPITGYAIKNFGWRPSYMFLGVMIALISLPFTLFVIRGKPAELGLTAYGEDDAPQAGAAVADLRGVTKAQALGTFQFYMVFVFAGLLGVTAAFMYHVPTYIISLGFDATTASTVVSAGMVGVTMGKLGVGYLIDRIGILKAGPLGILIGFVGVGLLYLSGAVGAPSLLMFGTLLFGVAYSCTVLEPPHVVKRIYGNRDYGAIYSYVMVASSFGTASGSSLFGFMRDATGSYTTSIVAVLGMLLGAATLVVAALVTGKSIQSRFESKSFPTDNIVEQAAE
jgi:MFS family permease